MLINSSISHRGRGSVDTAPNLPPIGLALLLDERVAQRVCDRWEAVRPIVVEEPRREHQMLEPGPVTEPLCVRGHKARG
eukprot:COSAG01_NODE_3028_length_6703_cov_2.824955_1_plen_79_part_00